MPKGLIFPQGIHVGAQAKGWMDEELVKDWLCTVWAKVGGLMRKLNLLVWDSFRQTDVAVIPGGMTSILQPLDVGMSKPFKDHLRQRWNKRMLDGEHSFIPAGRIRKPDLQLICKWILESWEAISPMTVRQSFLKCCITNAIDRTEDDLLWQDEDDTDPFNNEDAEVVDEEGELYYVEQDETSAVELNESDYRDHENDFEGFYSFWQLSTVEVTRILSNICDCLQTI